MSILEKDILEIKDLNDYFSNKYFEKNYIELSYENQKIVNGIILNYLLLSYKNQFLEEAEVDPSIWEKSYHYE